MRRAVWIVAAALGGGALTTLMVATLALGAGDARSALVTLQVAPRGPGIVSVVPVGGGVANTCTGNAESDDCEFSYERGTSVRLTATPAARPGKTFSGWSDADCGPGTTCTMTLDEDLTSVVATFAPLVLAVKLSNQDSGAGVTSNPAGQPCDADEQPNDDEVFCRTFPPRSRVELTLTPPSAPFVRWTGAADYSCEPANARTCAIEVVDQPTWVGALLLAGDDPPPLATTISVEFKLRKTGNGSGRVTASNIDCGTVCTTKYGYGRTVALTAAPDEGSLFDGWNGVCSRTQVTCRFPAGPITSIRVAFTQDQSPPSSPGSPTVGARTRTSLALSWGASTDNVRVTGYRVYVDGQPAGETQATSYTLDGLKCGRRYALAVDAADTLGHRSPRATLTAETLPCAFAARLAGVRVSRSGGARVVVVTVRTNRATRARLRLLADGRQVAGTSAGVAPGSNALRLRVPRRVPRGSYRLTTWLTNPDGGTLVLPSRGVLLPKP